MKSKTTIKERTRRKTNPELVETIKASTKNPAWHKIAEKLSSSRRKMLEINLKEIDKNSESGDVVVVAGKVLGAGNIGKKIRISALKFSKEALEKLKACKCETTSIISEMSKNPSAKGVRII